MTALGHAVSIDHLDHVSVKAGALGLRRALRNLIVNAATHGKGCSVSLTGQGGRAVLTIADCGPGIPPDLLNKAFEPFFRVDPARTQFLPGAELGLAIAKEIIERYGGTIRLENRQGGGLVQTVVFGAVS
ncbi:MAG: sensor histidine kinase [Mesorhizobium sp.]|nr:MAG: sensor histidine kinase [Mesorhizobium sp.]TIO58716.1 MAG: sensor histidine kinase [Mesorhizobium sp.]TJV63646.1 MAG: sensor histidine kinase [Mesorhizobium sp.]